MATDASKECKTYTHRKIDDKHENTEYSNKEQAYPPLRMHSFDEDDSPNGESWQMTWEVEAK